MRLIISNLETFNIKDLNTSKFLSPSCFKGKESEFENWDKADFCHAAFSNNGELELAENKVIFYANKQLNKYAIKFNKIIKKNKPLVYWRMLLMPWLMITI